LDLISADAIPSANEELVAFVIRDVDGKREQAIRRVLFLEIEMKVSQTESGVNDAESSRSGSLPVLGQFLAFDLEVILGLCLDRLDVPMEYLQLQSCLSIKDDIFISGSSVMTL